MTFGMPTSLFLQIHVALSLIGIVTGLVVAYGLLTQHSFPRWTAVFLATTALTSLTGYPLPPFGFDPPRVVGTLSLILLALAAAALYLFHMSGAWCWVYIAGAVAGLYLNVFVAVVQSFQKLSFLHALAPTQSEPPFAIVQGIVLLVFIVVGVLAVRRFRPATAA
jgi:uncharacterized membrane protein YccC